MTNQNTIEVLQAEIVRIRDRAAAEVAELDRQGKLNRSGRGIYNVPDACVTEFHSYASVPVRVYSVAETVADCFKFRSRGSQGLQF